MQIASCYLQQSPSQSIVRHEWPQTMGGCHCTSRNMTFTLPMFYVFSWHVCMAALATELCPVQGGSQLSQLGLLRRSPPSAKRPAGASGKQLREEELSRGGLRNTSMQSGSRLILQLLPQTSQACKKWPRHRFHRGRKHPANSCDGPAT